MANHPSEPAGAALAADWITIWQSEWAAIAVDQEALEMSRRLVASWSAEAQAAAERLADAEPAQCARSAPPARTAAVADAPDAGIDGSIEHVAAKPASDTDWL